LKKNISTNEGKLFKIFESEAVIRMEENMKLFVMKYGRICNENEIIINQPALMRCLVV